jgi:mono/diheme cytochrome c family protein
MITGSRTRLVRAATLIVMAGLIVLAGCEVRTPGTLETRLMQSTKRRLTIGGRSDVNPMPGTSDNIERGQKTFGAYCMVCHGLDGQNTRVPFAEKISPPVPPLSSQAVQSYSDG